MVRTTYTQSRAPEVRLAIPYVTRADFRGVKVGTSVPVNLSEIACNVKLGKEGLWTAGADSVVSYPEIGNEACFAIEDLSFWFNHRNNCILQAVAEFPAPGTFFDIGGGNGFVARALQQAGLDVVLVEPGLTGARNAIRRNVRQVVHSTLEDAGFVPHTLPAAGLFDVLEHVADDREFLLRIHRLLTGGGRLYLTVPAFQFLWSHEDEDAGHYRRYTLKSIGKVLETSGYTVEFASYFFNFLPLPILLRRALPYRLGLARKHQRDKVHLASTDHAVQNPYVSRVVSRLTRRELSRIAAGRRPMIGGSCLVVARASA